MCFFFFFGGGGWGGETAHKRQCVILIFSSVVLSHIKDPFYCDTDKLRRQFSEFRLPKAKIASFKKLVSKKILAKINTHSYL